ncbi:redoxin domain-containing protein [Roseiconus lacunae]|uniref:Redoxin domain-containing protein n=1 Tax=Roseiconus lacunae TaxID=2605694 RepID=A0ABT7PQH1_9BACT|nr:redoxin domain-containing protein [Roseiconus lacunae]MDM4018757.1 redoxin domain-containing protein [Roseiconus lacunae]
MRLQLLVAIVLATFSFHVTSVFAQKPETQPVLLQMVRDNAIHQELNLSSDQIEQIREALKPIDGPWFRVRIRPVEERIETIGTLTEQLENSLRGILTAEQTKRLDQLRNQALGTRMVVRDQVAAALGIDETERQSLYDTFRKTDAVVKDMREKVNAGEIDSKKAAAKVKQAQQVERKGLTDGLSTEQRIKLVDLTGESFDFSKVQRTYPVAPELTLEGAQWLQGSEINLEDLRGKVVAVHFYAFQCINCRRNLPHYNAWQTDYADEGLVIIGIQTPETSRERKPDEVAAAMRSENIEYPVLMDTQSANWKQWSNTMWPTVYLIDKQGYLRRWWQGELNWKETPGEQQMRQTIELLLAEED